MNALPVAAFPRERAPHFSDLGLPEGLEPNSRMRMGGLELLSLLPRDAMSVAFFDPQYRGVLDKLRYGNEGVQRGRRRSALQQMTEADIAAFISGIDRALIPSGHLFLWMDKFHLCQGFRPWFDGTLLDVVDLISWDKGRFGWVIVRAALPSTAWFCKNSRAKLKGCGKRTTFPILGAKEWRLEVPTRTSNR